jgi:PAS domain S-box-containing protein
MTTRAVAIQRYSAAVLFAAAALAARMALDPALGERAPFLILLMGVIFSAWYGGTGPGIVCTAVAAIAGTFFFVSERMTLTIHESGEFVAVGLFCTAGVVASWLIGSRRRPTPVLSATSRDVSISEEHLRGILENTLSIIHVKDLQGRFVYVNPRFEAVFGLSPQGVLGRTVEELFPRTAAIYTANDQKVLRTGKPLIVEEVAHNGDELQTYLSVKFPIRDERGAVVSMCGIATDITPFKRAEQALRESEARLRAVLDSLPVGVFIADAGGRLVEVNDAARQIWGGRTPMSENITDYERYRARTKDGRPLGPQDWPLARALSDGQTTRGEVMQIERFDGEDGVILAASAPVRTNGEQIGGVAAILDITELHKAQREIQQLNATLEERVRQRTADLEAFSYTVSHDLRAPLRAMEGFAQALDEDYGAMLDEMGRHYTRRIVHAAARMDRLITDLLQYSRLSSSETPVERVELSGVIAEAHQALEAEIARTRAVVTLPRGSWVVLAHRSAVVLAVQNLLSNAIKFTRPGESPVVTVTCERRGERVRLSVADRGIGVAPEHQQRVFRVFERLHSGDQYAGTGIGLAIVRRAVERAGGRAGLDSGVGEGATFWIELPLGSPA